MPRARISADGIEVARPGFDVDTAAIGEMQFSSALVAARIVKTGVVTPGPFSGLLSNLYLQSIVTFDAPFPSPPIILVAGLNSDGTSDQTPYVISFADGSDAYHLPYYEIRSYTDRFELSVYKPVSGVIRPTPTNWRYWVFQNTVET
ncbi:hypothetical protein [Aquamicrobium soli]|uniref:Uncharacterized protein n=1 Tax=Aquamicrobium soli TaxID=1811518 RepID=A0ABV7KD08_9HYPH